MILFFIKLEFPAPIGVPTLLFILSIEGVVIFGELERTTLEFPVAAWTPVPPFATGKTPMTEDARLTKVHEGVPPVTDKTFPEDPIATRLAAPAAPPEIISPTEFIGFTSAEVQVGDEEPAEVRTVPLAPGAKTAKLEPM